MKEKDVLLLVTKGESNKSIVQKLVLSGVTVGNNLNRVFKFENHQSHPSRFACYANEFSRKLNRF